MPRDLLAAQPPRDLLAAQPPRDLLAGKTPAGSFNPLLADDIATKEALMHAGTAMVAGFPAYLAGGLGTVAARQLGLTQADPKEVGGKWADFVTYQPRTAAGRELSETLMTPFQKLTEGSEAAGHWVTRKTDSPVLGAVTEATVQMLPALVGMGVTSGPTRGARPAPEPAGPINMETFVRDRRPAPRGAPEPAAATGRLTGWWHRTLGEPGQYRNLFSPLRVEEQYRIAQADRAASGMGHELRQAFPKLAEREQLTLKLARGDLSGLTPEQTTVASRLQAAYREIGEAALAENRLKGLREHYTPQIWDLNDPFTANAIRAWAAQRGKTLLREDLPRAKGSGQFSPFMLKRAITDIQTGMKLGLKPKTLDAVLLFETYARSMSRALMRGRTLNSLKRLKSEDGTLLALKKSEAPADYVAIGNPALEGWRVHPDIAPAVRVLLESDNPTSIGIALRTLAYASKRALVSYSGFHVTALMEAWAGTFPGKSLLNPKAAIDAALKVYREGGLDDALDDGLKGGLVIGAPLEDLMGRDRFLALYDKTDALLDKMGLRPAGKAVEAAKAMDAKLQYFLWDYVQTGLKIDTFLRKYEWELARDAERIGRGELTRESVARQAAEFTNATFGGLNWESMIDKIDTPAGRRVMADVLSATGRRWMQTLGFAPDWLVSTIMSWTNALSFRPDTALRAQLARRYLATSAVATLSIGNALNYYFTGHSMFENRSRKKHPTLLDNLKAKTEVQLGDGRRMNINKHFMEVPHLMTDPVGFTLNKANPLWIGETLEQLENRKWLSSGMQAPSIVREKDTTSRAARKRLAHVARKFTPIFGQAVMDEGISGLGGFFGLPIYGMTPKQLRELRREEGR